jgi:hypothetical protein
MLGYKEFSIDEALATADLPPKSKGDVNAAVVADFADLPPQIGPVVDEIDASFVTYISPATMRSSLERQMEEHGEAVLERENLKAVDPEVFYNLWWYCARFSLPLPLPVSADEGKDRKHYCALAAW